MVFGYTKKTLHLTPSTSICTITLAIYPMELVLLATISLTIGLGLVLNNIYSSTCRALITQHLITYPTPTSATPTLCPCREPHQVHSYKLLKKDKNPAPCQPTPFQVSPLEWRQALALDLPVPRSRKQLKHLHRQAITNSTFLSGALNTF